MPEISKGFGSAMNPKGERIRVIERSLDYEPEVTAADLG
jgi:hypothetical protein